MKFSVLIPVYNYPVSSLMSDLRTQVENLKDSIEIFLLEDGSEYFLEENKQAALDSGCHHSFQQNAGRAITRNRLAERANGEWLLFLDCDSQIPETFLQSYLEVLSSGSVFYGGTMYTTEPPEPNYTLHWKFGRKREALAPAIRIKKPYLSFKSNNFLVESDCYLNCPMDAKITTYGYEDLLWAFELKQRGIPVKHIGNPVVHLGLDSAEAFIKKTAESIDNLHALMKRGKLKGNETPLLRWHKILRRTGLNRLISAAVSQSEKGILKNLHSENPSLFLLDVYKLFLMEGKK